MLKSNWSIGTAEVVGHARVMRQRIGRARVAFSVLPHSVMPPHARDVLCARLERQAARKEAALARLGR